MEIAIDTRTFWLGESLGRIAVSRDDGDGLIGAVELTLPRGGMPPLHVHDEDQGFYVIDGRVTLYVGDAVHVLEVAESALAPRDVPHTFQVDSDTATLLVMSASGSFEDYVRAAGRPAAAPTLPPTTADPPGADELARIAAIAAEHGIEILGPPGTLPTAL